MADGGSYGGMAQGNAFAAKWSDLEAQAGVVTNTPVHFFLDADARTSSGYYATASPMLPLAAGTVAQTRVDAGAQTSGERYDARLGFGAFDFRYVGGAAGARSTFDGGIIAPGFSGSYEFDAHWTLQLEGGESFALPTVLENFVSPADSSALVFDRNAMLAETLTYGDLRRFHASLTSLSERVTGLDPGTVHSFGVSAAWQIAPQLSLRAWILRDNDFTQPYEHIYRFGANPQPATVGSYWLTYDAGNVRVDALYRRDLLNYSADPHFDASVSAAISRELRLYGSTERIAGTRTFIFGIRTQTP